MFCLFFFLDKSGFFFTAVLYFLRPVFIPLDFDVSGIKMRHDDFNV